MIERSFAHCYETGGMRRTHLRGHANILKRLLIHVAGCNLGLVMRARVGVGKPRQLADGVRGLLSGAFGAIVAVLYTVRCVWTGVAGHIAMASPFPAVTTRGYARTATFSDYRPSSTGC